MLLPLKFVFLTHNDVVTAPSELLHGLVHAAAWLASSWRRDHILRLMGFVALAAIGVTSSALLQYEGIQQVCKCYECLGCQGRGLGQLSQLQLHGPSQAHA